MAVHEDDVPIVESVHSIWTAFFTPIQFLLPLQVEGLVGSDSKETNLSLVLTAGTLVSLVASSNAGAFSDRTSGRMGRRHELTMRLSVRRAD